MAIDRKKASSGDFACTVERVNCTPVECFQRQGELNTVNESSARFVHTRKINEVTKLSQPTRQAGVRMAGFFNHPLNRRSSVPSQRMEYLLESLKVAA